jgi:hypothetical protein
MNRADFQSLSEIHLQEAKALLEARHFGGAYYLAGYAVECALKACICKHVNQYEFPISRTFSNECYSHDFGTLLRVADLTMTLNAALRANPRLKYNWETAGDWGEQSRYNRRLEGAARDLYAAITDPSDGVLEWIKAYW